MKTAQEIRDIIAETSIAGLDEIIVKAICMWSGASDVTINMYGDVYIHGTRLDDENILAFFAWNEAN